MESAHNIDPTTNLIGLSNIPDGSLLSGLPCIILLNAGFLHRVGPNRLNTILSRKLADAKFPSLRMDLSGLGDSMSRAGYAEDAHIVSEDLDKAMGFMQSNYGVKKFVLLGLCSGANDAAQKTIADTRVVGLLNIDGVGYRTRRFYVNHIFQHILRRIAQPERWRRLIGRFLHNYNLKKAGKPVQGSVLMNAKAYTSWSLEQAGKNLEKLAERGVRMHFIYTGGASGFYNYDSQFWDMFKEFDFKGYASISYFPSNDHLSMLQHHRDELLDNIVDWATASFGK